VSSLGAATSSDWSQNGLRSTRFGVWWSCRCGSRVACVVHDGLGPSSSSSSWCMVHCVHPAFPGSPPPSLASWPRSRARHRRQGERESFLPWLSSLFLLRTVRSMPRQTRYASSPFIYCLALQERDLATVWSDRGDCARCIDMPRHSRAPCSSAGPTRARVMCAYACEQSVKVAAFPSRPTVRKRRGGTTPNINGGEQGEAMSSPLVAMAKGYRCRVSRCRVAVKPCSAVPWRKRGSPASPSSLTSWTAAVASRPLLSPPSLLFLPLLFLPSDVVRVVCHRGGGERDEGEGFGGLYSYSRAWLWRADGGEAKRVCGGL
jgi:hypothetical protein